eukprot:TRINITY_DN24599_c0_g1_i1.p1 TRINITY_DN24599_c0_g1~~TRINITY_DN24599_c0_g1_i1.p1  ORF type:complete len:487 (+),score=104.93 TRINITY_DN24599_c0_g1_i1:75-1535(+)
MAEQVGYSPLPVSPEPVPAVEHLDESGWPGVEIIESDTFKIIVSVVIVLNVIVLSMETDTPGDQLPAYFLVFDNIFLVAFSTEFTAMLVHHHRLGWKAFHAGFSIRDIVFEGLIVFLGIFDLWVAPWLESLGMPQRVTVFARLLRLLRLVRVFRLFSPLKIFVTAIVGMMEKFIFIIVVLVLFVISVAVVLTELLGHGTCLGVPLQEVKAEHAEEARMLRGYFKDVSTSAFTLFQLMTTDNWDDVASPLVTINPKWRLFFYSFIAFASWIMISVLTAVASDTFIAATADRKLGEQAEEQANHMLFVNFLKDSFIAADKDGNGKVDKEEFNHLIKQTYVTERMKELGINMSLRELQKAWDMLDVDDSGELTIEEFVNGLSFLQEGLATKHIVHVDYGLKKITVQAEKMLEEVALKFRECEVNNGIIAKLLHKQEQFHERNAEPMMLWQRWVCESGSFLHLAQEKLPFMAPGSEPVSPDSPSRPVLPE